MAHLLFAALLFPLHAYAVDPAPYANTMPSQRPSIELPGVYKPQIPGSQSNTGFDTPRVCGNTALSGSDRLSCERDMSRAASEASRGEVRKKYDAQIANPPPEIAPKRPSAAPTEPAVAPKDEKEAPAAVKSDKKSPQALF